MKKDDSSLFLNRNQSRRIDEVAMRDFAIPGIVLMENAGRGVAEVILEQKSNGHVFICCGRGNNAGDGFVIARHLVNQGQTVTLAICADSTKLTGDAKTNYEIILRMNIPILDCASGPSPSFLECVSKSTILVDCLLGTGAKGAPRPPLDEIIRILNQHDAIRVAVDVPSGLDCDTGDAADPTFLADHTCTFVTKKSIMQMQHAQNYLGKVHVIDIGLPTQIIHLVLSDDP